MEKCLIKMTFKKLQVKCIKWYFTLCQSEQGNCNDDGDFHGCWVKETCRETPLVCFDLSFDSTSCICGHVTCSVHGTMCRQVTLVQLTHALTKLITTSAVLSTNQ